MFMQPTQKTKTIADIIAEKLNQQEMKETSQGEGGDSQAPRLHPKVIQVYRG